MIHRSLKITGCLVLLTLLTLLRPAGAQLPDPFALIPADTSVVFRIDMQAVEQNPRLAPILEAFRQQEPGFPESMLFSPDSVGGDSLAFLGKDFPGDIKILEGGLLIPENNAAPGKPEGYSVLYGQMDGNALFERFQAAGWTQQSAAGGQMVMKDPGGKMFMTMPNEWTMLLAPSQALMDKQMATAAGTTPSVVSKPGPLANFIKGTPGSLVFAAVEIPEAQRAMLAEVAAEPDPSMAMFPGVPQLMQELPKLQGVGAVLRDVDGMKLQLAMTFPDAETSGRAVAALNLAWPAALSMVRMMAVQQDPSQAAKFDQLMTIKFAANGANAAVAIPITDEDLAQVVQAIQQMQAGGAPGMMGGPTGAPPAPQP
ncbi:MAG: hypothetical protein PWP23_3197 [Candidatus Sumerlaeota bacterium]|nr:hypothetical protein [Candidatus Sumerlaeota bacterium]